MIFSTFSCTSCKPDVVVALSTFFNISLVGPNKILPCMVGTAKTPFPALDGAGYNTSIIETLFARDYVRREKKSLVPTDKGLAVYQIVKDKRIADVEMTGQWETALAKIESGEMNPDTFRKGIEVYAAQIIIFNDDILLKDLPHPAYLAAAPEFERDTKRMSYFNAGILVMNIQGMRIKYQQFVEMMKKRQRSTSGLFTLRAANQTGK